LQTPQPGTNRHQTCSETGKEEGACQEEVRSLLEVAGLDLNQRRSSY